MKSGYLSPIPCQEPLFYERVKTQLREKSNWTDSDELALMFRNTYAPAFYKQLHRYVHKSYRKHLALEAIKNLIVKPASTKLSQVKKAISLLYYSPSTWMAKQKLQQLENSIGS